MILDENEEELFYWPIGNLVEFSTSEVIIIKVPTPSVGYLRSSGGDDKIKIWAKWNAFPLNPFTDITNGPGINLNGIPGPFGEFAIYVEALEIENAFERVPVSVIHAKASKAGWTS